MIRFFVIEFRQVSLVVLVVLSLYALWASGWGTVPNVFLGLFVVSLILIAFGQFAHDRFRQAESQARTSTPRLLARLCSIGMPLGLILLVHTSGHAQLDSFRTAIGLCPQGFFEPVDHPQDGFGLRDCGA